MSTGMADIRLGPPGPFFVQRPTLSLILMAGAVLVIAFGQGAPEPLPTWQVTLTAINTALAGWVLTAIAATAMPRKRVLRLGLATLVAAGGVVVTAVIGGGSGAVCAGLAAAVVIALAGLYGRALLPAALIGVLPAVILAFCLVLWLGRRDLEAGPVLLPLAIGGFAMAIVSAITASPMFARRIAAGDGRILAAARAINAIMRPLSAAGLAGLLAGIMLSLGAMGDAQPALGTSRTILAFAVTPFLFGATSILMLLTLSLMPVAETVRRSSLRGWLASGMIAARRTQGLRPVLFAAIAGIAAILALSGLAAAPARVTGVADGLAGAWLSALRYSLFFAGLYAILVVASRSLRSAALITLPLVIADILSLLAIGQFGDGATAGMGAGAGTPWEAVIRVLILLILWRPATAWRAELGAGAKGRELMVRSLALGVPTALMALAGAALVISLTYLALGEGAVGASVIARLVSEAVLALMLAQCLGITLRAIERGRGG